jgi:hypothetical protein
MDALPAGTTVKLSVFWQELSRETILRCLARAARTTPLLAITPSGLSGSYIVLRQRIGPALGVAPGIRCHKAGSPQSNEGMLLGRRPPEHEDGFAGRFSRPLLPYL